MKKYIFTENQVKKIIDNQLNEQATGNETMESYQGVIESITNGVAKVKATSENNRIKYYNIKLKVNVPVGTGVFVGIKNGQPEIYGGKPNRKLN